MIKDTNPDHYRVNGADFVKYMHDPKISGFGNWMFANGFNSGVEACTNWTSVEDKLPDRSGKYLVYMSAEDRPIIKTSYWLASKQTWLGVEACSVLIHITHWMPLPEPPWRKEKHET